MRYRVEVFDSWGRRQAAFEDVPLLEAVRSAPDEPDTVRGLLPTTLAMLGPAFRIRVFIEDALFCDTRVVRTGPQWSDARKLILDKYVPFHKVLEVEAERDACEGNTTVSRAYTNQEISAIARHAINSARGAIHYSVAHEAYPDGAQRECNKFLLRKTEDNELEVGGIATGQWVSTPRIDASCAYAKDGDTIAGLVVDDEPWPDLRLMMIDAEETTRNSHAISRHPEVAEWTSAQYGLSAYKRQADAAKAILQSLMDTKGIEYIELNPHRNASGAYDDRVDAYGRYIGLVYGAGECFNAALVEHDLADVYLYEDGRYHVPEMALKDFFSYAGAHADSIAPTGKYLAEFDVTGGILEVLSALAYAAGGFVFDVDAELAVRFCKPEAPDRVWYHDPLAMGVRLGVTARPLANHLVLIGNPFVGSISKSYTRGESIGEYGLHTRHFAYFSISRIEDADALAEGLLADLAYPEPSGEVVFYRGCADVRVGDLVELRGAPLLRYDRELDQEWDARFYGRIAGRVRSVKHRLVGPHVTTTVTLTSPLRSVDDPCAFIVRSQPAASTLFEFRLDDGRVGVDMGFHLD